MDIKEYEKLITTQLEELVESIITANCTLNIPVREGERQGDAISKNLESLFVEASDTHQYFKDTSASPTKKTKNPFDVVTYFEYNSHREKIWIDFKAINIQNNDSNADSGTFKKVIELIKDGSFYLAYIYVYYQDSGAGTIQFEKNDGSYVKSYFLKDIGNDMHITPANQIQVNYQSVNVYRTREEFLDFFILKIKESYERRSADSLDMLDKISKSEIRLGNYKKPKPPKTYKRQPTVVKDSKSNTITFDELKRLNSEQEEKIRNL